MSKRRISLKKRARENDPAIILGGALICLQSVYDCTFLAEAQDVSAEYDKHALGRAIARAKTSRSYRLETALREALRLISALTYLQGDDQFAKYKESLEPILKTLEQKKWTE